MYRKFAGCIIRCIVSIRAAQTRWGLSRVRQRLWGGIPRIARRQVSITPLDAALDPRDLASLILQHLDACACLNGCIQELNVFPDILPEFRNQAHVAHELAFALSLYPLLADYPQLQRAHDALTRYWSSAWSTGGLSDGEYRTALKAAVLYLQQRAAAARQQGPAHCDLTALFIPLSKE